MDPKDEAKSLAEAAFRPGTTEDALAQKASRVFGSLAGPADPRVADVATALAPAIRSAPSRAAAIAATVVGYLCERGADPGAAGPALVERLLAAVHGADRLRDAALARLSAARTAGNGHADNPPHDPGALLAAIEELRTELPSDACEWDLLNQLLAPGTAMFGASPGLRASAASALPGLGRLEDVHDSASWLKSMILVLDGEPFVAVEPATGLGIAGRISGISVNFQLNVLLMDAFPQTGFLRQRRVSKQAVDVARGNGPQEASETIRGTWDLCAWTAIQPDGTVMRTAGREATRDWIWNEGRPVDIPVFEGARMIILAPPTYQRTWNCTRDFMYLEAEMKVERTLTKAEVGALIARMAAAPRPPAPRPPAPRPVAAEVGRR